MRSPSISFSHRSPSQASQDGLGSMHGIRKVSLISDSQTLPTLYDTSHIFDEFKSMRAPSSTKSNNFMNKFKDTVTDMQIQVQTPQKLVDSGQERFSLHFQDPFLEEEFQNKQQPSLYFIASFAFEISLLCSINIYLATLTNHSFTEIMGVILNLLCILSSAASVVMHTELLREYVPGSMSILFRIIIVLAGITWFLVVVQFDENMHWSRIYMFLWAAQIVRTPMLDFQKKLFCTIIILLFCTLLCVFYQMLVNKDVHDQGISYVLFCMLLFVGLLNVFHDEQRKRNDFIKLKKKKHETSTLIDQQSRLRVDFFDLLLDKIGYVPETDNGDEIRTPLDRAISLLREIRFDPACPEHLNEKITSVVVFLSSGNLFKPDMTTVQSQNSHMDQDVYNWVLSLVDEAVTDDGKMVERIKSGSALLNTPDISSPSASPGHKLRRLKTKINLNISDVISEDQDLSEEARAAEEEAVINLLHRTEEWDFDCFEVADHSYGNPLLFVALTIFKKHGLISSFQLDMRLLRNFLSVIEHGYKSENPYHNSIHAADVMHTMHYFLLCSGMSIRFSKLEIFATLIAACIHDFDHPGVNNNFLIATQDRRALLYNDTHVLENHHVANAFRLLNVSDNNFLVHLTKSQKATFRKTIINQVVSTDLSLHFELVAQFKSTIFDTKEISLNAKKKEEQNTMVLKMLLKAADIGHAGKDLEQHIRWSTAINEEFYMQGDMEKKLGLPISPIMDREKTNLASSQVGFLDILAIPLFEEVNKLFRKGKCPLISNAKRNRNYWKSLVEE